MNADSDPLKQSVSIWIDEIKAGDNQAAQEVWHRYFEKLISQAKLRLGNAPRRIADEEDVVISVFRSLCEGAANGRFNELSNRDDLWSLLVAMTHMKAVDQIRYQSAKMRGGEVVRGNSALHHPGTDSDGVGFDAFMGSDPTPEFTVSMQEQLGQLMDSLPDDSQKSVAKMRMVGHSNEEIAKSLSISLRSVERKLNVVRSTWTSMMNSEE